MDAILRAIVEPRRRDILQLVQHQEQTSGDIAAHFPEVTRPAISQHLKVLEDAGLLAMRKEGTKRLYQAVPERLAELKTYLEAFWDDRLQLLAREAETEERRSSLPDDQRN